MVVCVTDALLQPIRELEHATYWKTHSSDTGSVFYTPCKEENEGSRHCTLLDLPPHQVHKHTHLLRMLVVMGIGCVAVLLLGISQEVECH